MNIARLLISPPDQWAAKAALSIRRHLPDPEDLQSERRIAVALAGGSTPATVYESLTQASSGDAIWEYVDLYLSDERSVPLHDPVSIYRMARENFASRLKDPEPHLFPVDTAKPAADAAQAYEELICDRVSATDLVPSFDIVLLGLGEDGHTASLFPGAESLDETERLVMPALHPETGQKRITFTLPLIAAAHQVMFLVRGASKADIVRAIIEEEGASHLPAARAASEATDVLWLLDEAAAAKLSN
jgi:6-phosphogluconolactonase